MSVHLFGTRLPTSLFDGSIPTVHPETNQPARELAATPIRRPAARAVKLAEEPIIASRWTLSWGRRCFDIVGSGIALFFCFPIIVLAAILVRFSSPGPSFFVQGRMGRNGKEFALIKFRSMRVTRETPGTCHTAKGDPRITPIGALLRRGKLDELPQFWNVFVGDMSLVGPRPKLPHHESLLLPCRPGLTGAATLAFCKEEEILEGLPAHTLRAFYDHFIKPNQARLDIDYMQTATLRSDLSMLYQTACFICGFSRDRELHERMRDESVNWARPEVASTGTSDAYNHGGQASMDPRPTQESGRFASR